MNPQNTLQAKFILVGHMHLHIKLAWLILAGAGHATFRCFFLLVNRLPVLTSGLLCAVRDRWGDIEFSQFSYLQ